MPSTTPNMSLVIPTVGNAAVPDGGPGYATEINAAINLIDAHDHSSGKGLPVTQNGINITGALPFQTNPATGLTYIGLTNQTAALATTRTLYNVNGELYWTDGSGNQVAITAAGAVNTGATGNLSGMDGLAAVTYSAITKTFTLTQTAAFPAKVAMGDLSLFETVAAAAQTITIKAPAGLANTFTLTLPGALPATNVLPQFSSAGVLSFLSAPGATSLLQSTAAGALSWITSLPSGLTYPAPVFSGTATGTYTLGGTPTITAPAISAPVLSGTVTGTYTLGGTPTITAPTINAGALSGTFTGNPIFSQNPVFSGSAIFTGQPLFEMMLRVNKATLNADFTLDPTDSGVVIGNKASALAVALQTWSNYVGGAGLALVFLHNIGAGTMTITPNGAEKINGAASLAILQHHSAILFACGISGNEWITLASS